MLNKIIHFSINHKLVIGLFIIGLVSWGSYEITRLPIDAVPDITNNQVQVITVSPNLGAPDVERFITVPVEQSTRNVPGIVEQRSFSRFGLSIVTIVFDESTDVYWARQQVTERLVQAKQQIPPGMGEPELGPVTTGLGEIFQYVVKARPGYEGRYSLVDLRTIQDWVIRRQLLGTEGVAEVSSFGGLLKQYEVAVKPEKLKSFGLTITDVFNALQNNNQNTGGAYIEKGPSVLFIRTEGLVQDFNDIRRIAVKRTNDGIPVLVQDIADVHTGSAIRYGAMVYNNEGEVCGAVVMMLKGENSNKVIKNIKAKIKEIEKSLPEGVMIEAFLDRTKMVNNAIGTVERNLAEGALIVVFVLVIFLGNLRAGFIVASVIPLSMLFAVIMMNAFGVSGNLMSLGALDFGLLVDGAVIIVEAVMHKLKDSPAFARVNRLSQVQMDGEVKESSGKMMNSAVFGQMIILIVYLPILSLQGIEGKMFKPMAQTVSFAILGSFLLSFTYVPMMSALCLSRNISHRQNWSERMMHKLQNLYGRLLKAALKLPIAIIGAALLLFAVAVLVLSRLGGEFIPQLEEGDFAVETRMLTGSSLTTMIENTRKTAGILKQRFPEVQKVVTKIGNGEVPTDPMPLEAADMMVILKPKSEWTTAETFPELAEKMSTALQEVPGVTTGFQFPVQMRFNELMTGARQDVVCKIFGENLDTLALYAGRLGRVVQGIKGTRDVYVETVTGISQMVITYNRDAMAAYGADISNINTTVQSAYAGAVAGVVYEADKKFDLVVRMDAEEKKAAGELENLLIPLSNGRQVPLNSLAKVEMKEGPYQVQRENAARRITVGFNIRGRDVQSIVTELQQKVAAQVKLPPAYTITYGGQYENLQHATQRLSLAVPVALLLILLLLYLAFHQVKYGLLIFSAIPLSAIGGVIALSARGMPFSISAGVGFIALFGVAVLNGIVMISEMNKLKKEGMTGLKNIIMQAAQTRLRPVLMTASVASLGFLPMALSNGAGAEVQRPLATVVIGGLVTATLLTLFVLPCLYLLFEKKHFKKLQPAAVIVLLLCLAPSLVNAQQKLTMKEAVDMAKQQNLRVTGSRLQERYFELLKASAADVPKTQINAELGNVNSAFIDNRFGVSQSFALPSVYKKQKLVLEDEWQAAKLQTTVQQADIVRYVKLAYVQLAHIEARQRLLQRTDSVLKNYVRIAGLRYEKGETSLLEKTMLENQASQVTLQMNLLLQDKQSAQAQLAALLNSNSMPDITDTLDADIMLFDTTLLQKHPLLQYYRQQEQLAQHQSVAEKARLSPELMIGYTNQSFIGWQQNKQGNETYYNGGRRFSTVQAGIAVPLFNKMQKAKVKAAQQHELVVKSQTGIAEQQLRLQLQEQLNEYNKYKTAVEYFNSHTLKQAAIIIRTANLQYKNGEINYIEWGTLTGSAIGLQAQYLDALKELNMRKAELEYLLEPNDN
ncbi:CusA/CzcA family heavy metal efflux RND transporter [Foetidibacter luteolus]|uniref:CusA/CzcA family heavy metal efflux RND transporter n=1 Tax=Foetidibacter luteolus TaxID=2608880 RepID=UPI00129B7655|nr:CusA/CzcA family heavy metal efflux RND transporter [Foetidibacter luteolus]